ncbi:MAG: hypothetical protein JXM68_09180, partial [Sedimentisphaerales bacterium]|nr:hypothetical protein [Sedimentisphaerales bacterium]
MKFKAYFLLSIAILHVNIILGQSIPGGQPEVVKTEVSGEYLYQTSGEHKVTTYEFDWFDNDRERDVPVMFYLPESDKPVPLIVFSHGLGGDRYGYTFLMNYWASHGFACLMLQHPGSDSSLWLGKGAIKGVINVYAAANANNAVLRMGDMRFALDMVRKLNVPGEKLEGRFDLERLGIAGHSFGAHTTLACANAGMPFKAAIPMSAPSVGGPVAKYLALNNIKIPCMHMTGTEDDSPIGETKASQRREPFDYLKSSDQYLVNFDGGDHMIFAGMSKPGIYQKNDLVFIEQIKTLSTAFWYYYLNDSSLAGNWLQGKAGGYLDKYATFEMKVKGSLQAEK